MNELQLTYLVQFFAKGRVPMTPMETWGLKVMVWTFEQRLNRLEDKTAHFMTETDEMDCLANLLSRVAMMPEEVVDTAECLGVRIAEPGSVFNPYELSVAEPGTVLIPEGARVNDNLDGATIDNPYDVAPEITPQEIIPAPAVAQPASPKPARKRHKTRRHT